LRLTRFKEIELFQIVLVKMKRLMRRIANIQNGTTFAETRQKIFREPLETPVEPKVR
jgi:hypothetical protein